MIHGTVVVADAEPVEDVVKLVAVDHASHISWIKLLKTVTQRFEVERGHTGCKAPEWRTEAIYVLLEEGPVGL